MNSTEEYLASSHALIIHDFIYSIKFKIILGTVWSVLLILGIIGINMKYFKSNIYFTIFLFSFQEME